MGPWLANFLGGADDLGTACDGPGDAHCTKATRAGIGPARSHIGSGHAVMGLQAGALKAKAVSDELAGLTAGIAAGMHDAVGATLHSTSEINRTESLVLITLAAKPILGCVMLGHSILDRGTVIEVGPSTVGVGGNLHNAHDCDSFEHVRDGCALTVFGTEKAMGCAINFLAARTLDSQSGGISSVCAGVGTMLAPSGALSDGAGGAPVSMDRM